MKVLLLDNTLDRDSWGSAELVHAIHEAGQPTVFVRRAPHADLPALSSLGRFDRIILSGSRTAATDSADWITALDELIRQALDRGIPMLGICYGHQAIARVLRGGDGSLNVRRSATPEIGWTEIQRTPGPRGSPDLLDGLPERFHSFSVHYDEVCATPPGALLLARSERCAIQAFALEDKPAFGVQFHPERDVEAGERTIATSAKKKLDFPLLNPGSGRKFHSPLVARTIFGNFLKGFC
jgi:GMP synthase (glutamine-hydrolysing)